MGLTTFYPVELGIKLNNALAYLYIIHRTNIQSFIFLEFVVHYTVIDVWVVFGCYKYTRSKAYLGWKINFLDDIMETC